MTFAPESIKQVRAFLKGEDPDLSDVELGIVGGPSHVLTGTSYHLGADQLKMYKNPYSARTARDLAGLSDAASALDVDEDLDELRQLSVWCVEECRRGAPDTLDIREIIYSPDGVQVLRWDRERGVNSEPQPDDDLSHRSHTHFSWYRDSEFRNKVALFQRFYQEGAAMTQPDHAYNLLNTGARLEGSATYPDGEYGSISNALALNHIDKAMIDAKRAVDALKVQDAKIDELSVKIDNISVAGVDIPALVEALMPEIENVVTNVFVKALQGAVDALNEQE